MERDLNLKRMFKMYLKNIWILILCGIIVAAVFYVYEGQKAVTQKTVTKTVFLVFDMGGGNDDVAYAKRQTYFDAYRSLIGSTIFKNDDSLTDTEKAILSGLSIAEGDSNGIFTYTAVVDSSVDDATALAAFDKYAQLTEDWLVESYDDDTIEVQSVKESVSTSSSNTKFYFVIGFFVGIVLAALVLFIIFVLDKKVRDEKDVEFYSGINCLGTIKENQSELDALIKEQLKPYKKIAIIGLSDKCGKTYLADKLPNSVDAGNDIEKAAECDAVIICVARAQDNGEELASTVKKIQNTSLNLAGIILNNHNSKREIVRI